MNVEIVKIVVMGIIMVGAFVVTPVVMALLSHQQKMAQLFAKQNLDQSELLRRLDLLERKVASAELAAPPPSSDDLRSHLEADRLKRSS
ncbi:MAG TPA: hypothetical protein VG820_01470 [Fimbriimonadaceae bacterium]|nr:hypothetical protein [Fimbriimonadaceae bacterium]